MLGALRPSFLIAAGVRDDAASNDGAERRRQRRGRFHAWLRNVIYRRIGWRVRQREVSRDHPRDPDTDAYLQSHVCLKPFQNLDTTNRGHAHVCCPDWLPTPIADLGSDLLEQWSGPVARKIRASVTDGSYRYCSRLFCSEITNRSLPHRDSPEVVATLAAFAAETVPPPRRVGLSHDRSCNLACPSCRTQTIVADKGEQKKLDTFVEKTILPLLKVTETAYITGSGDPFGSAHFRRVLKQLDRRDFPHLTLDLHTNAQLFDARAFEEFDLDGRIGHVEISIDAAEPATYAVVRRGGDFARLRRNLAFVRDLRKAGKIAELEFSFVVQTRNFREMPAFVRLGEEFAADIIGFQMIRNWGTFSADEFAQEFIGDPAHPQHQALIAILQSPELSRPIVRVGNILGYTDSKAA